MESNKRKTIGKVAALEKNPTTIDNFCFWTDKKTILNPFDVVVVDHINGTKTYGVVEEISHITDAESFLGEYFSNDFGNLDSSVLTERIGMNYVSARVVGNTGNIYIPVHSGAKVSLGSPDDIQTALGLDKVKNPVVCGCLEMYSGVDDAKVNLPVYVNSDFLIGPEGAHLNISGISGLASKTSYAMFLLNALQQKSHSNTSDSSKVAYIFMNVKGRDLLSIDQPSSDLDDTQRQMYAKMGLEEIPFKNVKYFYPYGGKGKAKTYAKSEDLEKQLNKGQAKLFKYTFNDDNENLDLLFSNIEDPNQTIESIINYIVSKQNPFNNVDSWKNMIDAVDQMGLKGGSNNKEISVMSWRKFKRIIRKSIGSDPMFGDEIEKSKHQTRLEDEIKNLKSNDVFVIDIAKQEENMQAFVFGSIMQAVTKLKLGEFDDDMPIEDRQNIPDRIIIFVDELNKYASSETPKSSPILRLLLDIAERGRSLGIVLFSAEQFKSAIHKRITGNCSTHAYGRTNSIEVADKAYSFVPSTYKNMMTRLKQGEYIIQNPIFHSLLKIKFPKPLYKQDKGEA